MTELAGKVAVVTGGASGLGEGLVRRFAAEGAAVVIGDVETARGEALAAELPDAAFVKTDVSDVDQVGALVSAAVDRFGGLDVMVNNAGVSGRMHRRFLEDDLADFHQVMGVNVLGVMAGTRDAARYMSQHGGGSIINLTSIGGIQAGGGVMSYRASKAAVIQFTKSAAIELAYHEIRVNAIAPGNIRTAIVSKSATGEDLARLEQFEEGIRAQMRADRPLKREGTVEDVAEAALYFAGERSRYVTGTVLPIDGGTVAGKVLASRARSAANGTG
jgi:NAD(P)-dependent dehydrogenase (short-subunit alcohol dehydrogenase family)